MFDMSIFKVRIIEGLEPQWSTTEHNPSNLRIHFKNVFQELLEF